MSNDPKSTRERADAKFDKAQRTTDDARVYVEANLAASRKKTDRLRAMRLAQEAAASAPEPDKKPARAKKAALAKKKAAKPKS